MWNIVLGILFAFTEGDLKGIPKTQATPGVFNTVLRAVFAVIGAMALLYVTLAGFKYVTSGGDPNAVAKAKNQILYGIIGLIVAISAYSLVGFVLQRI